MDPETEKEHWLGVGWGGVGKALVAYSIAWCQRKCSGFDNCTLVM